MHSCGTVKVLIGIVTYNHQRFIAQCLDSVAESLSLNSFKVVLIDNCSSDGSAQTAGDRHPSIEIFEQPHRCSFAANNNLAFRSFHSEYFLMLNPDTVLEKGVIDTLVEFMDAHPDCGACGPRLVFPDGSLQYSCRRFPTIWSVLLRRSPIRLLLPREKRGMKHLMITDSHNNAMQVDWMLGACLLVRRAAIMGAALLDERFPLYCEDIDLGLRLKKGGWKVYYLPSATVIHHHLAKSDSKFFCRESLLHAISMIRFVIKHYFSLNRGATSYLGVKRWEPESKVV